MAKKLKGRKIISQNMKILRKRKGWSQETLGEKAKLHRTYIGSIERREQNVSIDNIERLANCLGVKIHVLLGPKLK